MQLRGPAPWSTRLMKAPANGGVGVEQRLEELRVVGVRRREQHVQRESVRVDQQVVLRAGFAPVSGVRAGQLAPLICSGTTGVKQWCRLLGRCFGQGRSASVCSRGQGGAPGGRTTLTAVKGSRGREGRPGWGSDHGRSPFGRAESLVVRGRPALSRCTKTRESSAT